MASVVSTGSHYFIRLVDKTRGENDMTIKTARPKLVEYDAWVVMCLICEQDLAVEGARPTFATQTEHMATHDVDYRQCEPEKDGYANTTEKHNDGSYDYTSQLIIGERGGQKRQVMMHIRAFGAFTIEEDNAIESRSAVVV